MKALRKALSALVAAASLITSMAMQPVMAAEAADAGLLPQGTFESYNVGDTISDTAAETNTTGVAVSNATATVVTDSYTGSKALKIVPKDTNDMVLNLRFQVEKGKSYYVSFDVRREVSEGWTNGTKNIEVDLYNNYRGGVIKEAVANDGSIKTHFVKVTAEADGGLQRMVKIMLKSAGSTDFVTYIDNICVYPYDTANIMPGADFERYPIGSTANIFESKGTIVDDSANGGSKAVKITEDASGAEVGISMYTYFEEGSKYNISFDVRRDVPAANDATEKAIAVQYIGNWATLGTYYIKNNTKTYVTINTEVVATKTEKGRVKLALTGAGFEGAETYIDNVKVTKVNPDKDANRIFGGDFENYAVGAAPTNITAQGNANIAGAAVVEDNGSKAVKIAGIGEGDENDQMFNLYFPTEAGITYRLEMDVRRTTPEGYPNKGIFIDYYDYLPGKDTYFYSMGGYSVANNDDVQTIATSFTANKTTAKARLKFNMKGTAEGVDTYIDNIRVYPMTSGNELISNNPSFEDASAALPEIGGVDAVGVVSADAANTGSKSLKITGENLGVNYKKVELEAGKTYRFGAYVKMADDAGYGSFYARVMGDAGEKAASYGQIMNADNGFVFVSVLYTPAADEEVRLNLWFNQPTGVFTAYVDDVVLDVVDTSDVVAVEDNLLKNGTFEKAHDRHLLDYKINAANTAATPYYSKAADYVRTGDVSLKVVNKNANGEISFPIDNVNPGEEYKITAWVKADAAQTVSVKESAANTTASTAAAEWTKLEKTAAVPAGKSILYFTFDSDAADGVYYIDDVSVIKLRDDCEFDSAKLMKQDGESWVAAGDDAFSAGSWKYSLSGVVNYSDSAKNIGAIVAVYDSEKLVAVEAKVVEVGAGLTEETIETDPVVVDDATGKTIKTFIWDMDTIKPYDKPLKVLILGNSLTSHAADPRKGWLGTWGMAATTPEKDYAHQLQTRITTKNPGARVMWGNFADFERCFYNWDSEGFNEFSVAGYQQYVDFDADVILVSIGENINNANWEKEDGYVSGQTFSAQQYKNIIDHFNPGDDAVIIVRQSGTFFSDVADVIADAVEAYAWDSFYMENWTGVSEAEKAEGLANGTFTQKVNDAENSGVLAHPGDAGMTELADAFWNILERKMDIMQR